MGLQKYLTPKLKEEVIAWFSSSNAFLFIYGKSFVWITNVGRKNRIKDNGKLMKACRGRCGAELIGVQWFPKIILKNDNWCLMI